MATNDEIAQVTSLLNGAPEDTADEIKNPGDESEIIEGQEVSQIEEGDTEELEEGEEIEVPKTLNELAEAIDVDMEYLYSIQIGMGDNQDPISVGELKDEYQSAVRTVTNLQEQLDNQKAETESGTQQQQISAQAQQAQFEILKIQNEFQSIDWERFEAEDPGQAALARQKFMEQHQFAQGTLQQVAMAEQAAEQEYLQGVADKSLELIPEWKDETVRKTEHGQIKSLLSEIGYPEGTFEAIRDPLNLVVIRRLIQAEAKIANAGNQVNKVRKAPKVLRSSNGRFKSNPTKRVEKAKQAVSSNRTRQTEEAAVKAILGVK